MLPLIAQLIRHKWWANNNVLQSVEQYPQAADDPEIRKLLHHILVSNRYWILLTLGQPFIGEEEKRIPGSHGALAARFAETERMEVEWLARATTEELDRKLQPRALPGTTISVLEAMTQTVLHSQGHRSQCATRLRVLGCISAGTDFVLWVRDQGASA